MCNVVFKTKVRIVLEGFQMAKIVFVGKNFRSLVDLGQIIDENKIDLEKNPKFPNFVPIFKKFLRF